jgi:hypothetical protein
MSRFKQFHTIVLGGNCVIRTSRRLWGGSGGGSETALRLINVASSLFRIDSKASEFAGSCAPETGAAYCVVVSVAASRLADIFAL